MRLIRIDGFSAGTVRKEGGEIKDKEMLENAFFHFWSVKCPKGDYTLFLGEKKKAQRHSISPFFAEYAQAN